jgi:cholesterol transport system auxiliary component
MNLNKMLLLSVTVVLVMMAAGCGDQISSGDGVSYFMIDVSRVDEPAAVSSGRVLVVRRFEIASRFRSAQLIYRTGESQFEADSYNQFMSRPEQTISEQTRIWLSSSGLFASVVNRGSLAEAGYDLEANITSLYGDFRNRDAAKAVMAIHFFLIDSSGRTAEVVFDKPYEVGVPLANSTAADLVVAYKNALTKILQNLETDLRVKLQNP